MTTAYTTLLGFALPVEGELDGTWGDVVNQNITELVEDSIAATATQSVTSGNWTLTTTGSGAVNQARCAILVPTGTPGVTRNIIAPSSSKAYVVDNQSDAAVVVKGSATTGTTIAAGARALVAWTGTDFVTIATSTPDGVTSVSGTGTVQGLTLSGTVTSTGSLTLGGSLSAVSLTTQVSGTLPIANGGTGQTTQQTALNALAGATTSGQYLRGNGANVQMSAIQVADVPTLNQNTTGTAANVTGTVAIANGGTGATDAATARTNLSVPSTTGSGASGSWGINVTGTAANVTGTVAIANGGTGATTASGARTNLGATTVGSNLFTLTNPSAVTFPQFNADNTVSALSASAFRTAIGAGTGGGSVTSVGGTGSVNGITLTGTVTSTGNLTLGGTLSGVSLTTQVSGTLPIANGGTGATTAATARTALDVPSSTGSGASGTWGINITGNAATATNGVVTTGSYADPSWITSLAGSKVTGNISGNAANVTGTVAVANGGTGLTSTPVNGALDIGNGTGFTRTTITAGSGIQVTNGPGSITITSLSAGGSVTSVGLSVPTGFAVANSPVTTAGTIALSFASGYSLPTNASQTNWDTAYTDRLKWDGGSTGLVAATGRTSLGATTVGGNLFTLGNPSAVTFLRINADNTVSTLDAATFRTAIGAGTGSGNGTVTSVSGTGSVNGLTLTGTVTSTGSLTLGGVLSGVDLTTQVTGVLPIANGGTGANTAANARTALDVPSTSGTGASGTWNINVTGNAANITGTAAIANGGTGATTAAAARTNLSVPSTTGSGASGTWGISISGNAATATSATSATSATTATSLTTTNFTVAESGGKLVISYLGTPILSISSAGVITAASNVTAYGTP